MPKNEKGFCEPCRYWEFLHTAVLSMPERCKTCSFPKIPSAERAESRRRYIEQRGLTEGEANGII